MATTFDSHANNAETTLNSNLSASQTSCIVRSASDFPSPNFNATIWDAVTYPNPTDDSNMEIVKVTAGPSSSKNWSITRAQESTTAVAHDSGSKIALLFTAKLLTDVEDAINSGTTPGHTHVTSELTDVTSTYAELNILDGVTSTYAELNKLDGASANVTATNLNALTGGSSTALHSHADTDKVRILGNANSAEQNSNNSSKPAKTVNNGTHQDDTTLDFDADTDEYDEWEIIIPPGITISAATLYIAYRMASATTKEVVWFCSHNGVADGETWDEAFAATDTFAVDTVPDATTKAAIASKALTTTAWAAGDSLRLRIGRDANNEGDDATGDAKMMYWMLEISYT